MNIITQSRRAALMLVAVTMLWGLSFPLMKTWQEEAKRTVCPAPTELHSIMLATLTLVAIRMAGSILVLTFLRPRFVFGPSRRAHCYGTLIGVTFFLGYALQVLGLSMISPALSGFITSLSCAWVPILAFTIFRIRFPLLTLLGMAIGIAGVAVLAGVPFTVAELAGANPSGSFRLGTGEVLTLIATVVFAWQILLIDRWGRKVQAAHLTAGLLSINTALAFASVFLLIGSGNGFAPWWSWLGAMLQQTEILGVVIGMVILSTATFHWMNTYQPQISAGRAALIYLLEPVFAAGFSVLIGHDAITLHLLAGGGLVLAGNFLVEWRPRTRAANLHLGRAE